MTLVVPKGWKRWRLEEVAADEPNAITDGPFGSSLKSSDYDERGGVRVIRLGNLGIGRFLDDDRSFVTAEKFAELRKHEACAGDLVVAALAHPVGRCVQVPPALGPAIVKADCMRVRVGEAFDPRFVLHALNSPDGLRRAEATAHGMGRLRMNLGDLRGLEFAAPPLPEQKRIVAKIEELTARSRRAKAALDAVPPLLDQLRQSILAAAFRGDLTADWRDRNPQSETATSLLDQISRSRSDASGPERRSRKELGSTVAPASRTAATSNFDEGPGLYEIPTNWRWVKLGTLASLHNGDRGQNYPNRDEYVDSGVPFINTGHIDPDGSLSSERMNHIARAKFLSLSGGRVRRGDLVYCLRGATLGKTAVVEIDEGAIASSLVIVRPCIPELSFFLYLFLVSPGGRLEISKYNNGTAQPNLSAESVGRYLVPLPPLCELTALTQRVKRHTEVLRPIGGQVEDLRSATQLTEHAILAAAFRGELT